MDYVDAPLCLRNDLHEQRHQRSNRWGWWWRHKRRARQRLLLHLVQGREAGLPRREYQARQQDRDYGQLCVLREGVLLSRCVGNASLRWLRKALPIAASLSTRGDLPRALFLSLHRGSAIRSVRGVLGDHLAQLVGDSLRRWGIIVGEHHDGIAKIRIDVEYAIHTWKGTRVSDDALAVHRILGEAVAIPTTLLIIAIDSPGKNQLGGLRVEKFVAA